MSVCGNGICGGNNVMTRWQLWLWRKHRNDSGRDTAWRNNIISMCNSCGYQWQRAALFNGAASQQYVGGVIAAYQQHNNNSLGCVAALISAVMA